MTTRTAPTGKLTRKWLKALLAGLGSTADEVAATLRAAGIKGSRTECHDCPGARYIASKARELVPAADQVTVTLTADKAVIDITRPGTDDYREVRASTPGALEDFLDGFDSGDYDDLAEECAA
jgi:hypothetical protein